MQHINQEETQRRKRLDNLLVEREVLLQRLEGNLNHFCTEHFLQKTWMEGLNWQFFRDGVKMDNPYLPLLNWLLNEEKLSQQHRIDLQLWQEELNQDKKVMQSFKENAGKRDDFDNNLFTKLATSNNAFPTKAAQNPLVKNDTLKDLFSLSDQNLFSLSEHIEQNVNDIRRIISTLFTQLGDYIIQSKDDLQTLSAFITQFGRENYRLLDKEEQLFSQFASDLRSFFLWQGNQEFRSLVQTFVSEQMFLDLESLTHPLLTKSVNIQNVIHSQKCWVGFLKRLQLSKVKPISFEQLATFLENIFFENASSVFEFEADFTSVVIEKVETWFNPKVNITWSDDLKTQGEKSKQKWDRLTSGHFLFLDHVKKECVIKELLQQKEKTEERLLNELNEIISGIRTVVDSMKPHCTIEYDKVNVDQEVFLRTFSEELLLKRKFISKLTDLLILNTEQFFLSQWALQTTYNSSINTGAYDNDKRKDGEYERKLNALDFIKFSSNAIQFPTITNYINPFSLGKSLLEKLPPDHALKGREFNFQQPKVSDYKEGLLLKALSLSYSNKRKTLANTILTVDTCLENELKEKYRSFDYLAERFSHLDLSNGLDFALFKNVYLIYFGCDSYPFKINEKVNLAMFHPREWTFEIGSPSILNFNYEDKYHEDVVFLGARLTRSHDNDASKVIIWEKLYQISQDAEVKMLDFIDAPFYQGMLNRLHLCDYIKFNSQVMLDWFADTFGRSVIIKPVNINREDNDEPPPMSIRSFNVRGATDAVFSNSIIQNNLTLATNSQDEDYLLLRFWLKTLKRARETYENEVDKSVSEISSTKIDLKHEQHERGSWHIYNPITHFGQMKVEKKNTDFLNFNALSSLDRVLDLENIALHINQKIDTAKRLENLFKK